MRVLVTGSRAWRDWRTMYERLQKLPEGSTIVHGAATGADHMARSAALVLGHEVEDHFPDYALWTASGAPLKRNEHMVALGADLVLAFPTVQSRGTWHCYTLASRAGIPGEVIGEILR